MQDDASLGDSLLSWVIRGIHVVQVDRRRRQGAHSGLRRMLADDGSATENSEPWRDLASALRRQAISQGLHQLGPREKEVVRLAYLEGRTNREIAARLGVSISTVRRRLGAALGDMEAFLRRSGGALSTWIVLTAGEFAERYARAGRRWWSSAHGMHSLLATGVAAVGVASTVAIVSLAPAPATSSPAPRGPQATARPAPRDAGTPASAVETTSPPLAGSSLPDLAQVNSAAASGAAQDEAPAEPGTVKPTALGVKHVNQGCDGNPTSAPPVVPVGPRKDQVPRAPVSHPGAGGCRG
ncbi:MAG: sigma-70 family RNA polymerase sigma factor [Chloroflexota bacterium]